MGKIMKYLGEHKAAVMAIFLLLIVQAYCDLSLPQYMSDIVDIGIQQSGIEYAVPEEMRAQTMDGLCLFLSEEDAARLQDSYEMTEDGNYRLKGLHKEELQDLEAMLGLPMVAMSSITQETGIEVSDLQAMLESGQMTKEQVLQAEEAAKANMGDMSESIISQKARLMVKQEYKSLGYDMGAYQSRYMLRTGSKMLAVSVVMMLAAIVVGLFASRTSAKIGMTLRGRVFHKVVRFSGSEMEQFSTASLITRSTNDIQQVQMVSVLLLRMILYAPIIGIGGVWKVSSTKTGMGWIIGIAVGTIILLVGVLMAITMPKFKKMQTLVDRLNLVSREILTGVPVIRAFSREKFEEERFAGANQDLMRTQLFTSRVMSMMMPAMMLIMNCITVMIVWFGAQGVAVSEWSILSSQLQTLSL